MTKETEIVNAEDLQTKLTSIMERVKDAGIRFVVTNRGSEACAIVSLEDLQKLENMDRTRRAVVKARSASKKRVPLAEAFLQETPERP